MNWIMRQMDSALGWYAERNAGMKVLLMVPIVLIVGVIVALGIIAACLRRWTTISSTTDEVHDKTKTIIQSLDEQLRDTSRRVDNVRAQQAELREQIQETANENESLHKKVDEMSHEELKAFMRKKAEK